MERRDQPLLGYVKEEGVSLHTTPLVGALFRSTTTRRSKDKFFVFLRCSVLRASEFEDLKFISQRAMPDARIENDWPRVEPRVMR